MSEAPTKAELVEALRRGGDEAIARLRALPVEVFAEGRYESGWNGRQILAHVAAIEWTYPRLLDIPKQAQAEAASAGGTPSATAQGGMDGYNARQVEKRAERSVSELIDELAANRAATIAAVEAADEGLFGQRIRSAGGLEGTLGSVFMGVAVQHLAQHVKDIAGA